MAQALVRARVRRWRKVRSGWLVVEPATLSVYRNRILRQPVLLASFPACRLTGAELDKAASLVRLTLEGNPGETASEEFSFSHVDDAKTVYLSLSELLRQAEEAKRRQEEEAARLRKELEEHQQQVREQFASDVWDTAEAIWGLARTDYAMASAVIAGDWNEARQQYSTVWQRADALNSAHDIELMASLKELDEGVSAQDGEEVIKKAASLLKGLADQVLCTEALRSRWKQEEDVVSPISPNWSHVPYFLLFSAGFFEVELSLQIEDWAAVSDELAVLRSIAPVLKACFKVGLEALLNGTDSAVVDRNAVILRNKMQRVEEAVAASFKTRPFECAQPAPERNGDHDGTVSE